MTSGVGALGYTAGVSRPSEGLWDRLAERWDLVRAPRADEVELSFVPAGAQKPFKLRFYVLSGWFDRLRGLLGTSRGDARASPVAIVGCASVHTFGMSFSIDVALVGRDGVVLAVARDLPPRRVCGHRDAACALERPCESGPWPEVGQRLWSPAGWSWGNGWYG